MRKSIKAINKKIEQSKAQYNLDRKTAKISALSWRNVSEYEFLTSKDVLPEKDLLGKTAELKIFEYSLLGKKLKAQTDIAKKQYQKLDDEKINKKSIPKEYNKLDLVYNTNHSFYNYYCNNEEFEQFFKWYR